MKTAVEWLVSQLNKKGFAQVVTDEEIEQAKEMEKQQIIDAHGTKKDYSFSQIDPKTITGEQYYNETFKKENNENKN
jgi:predicted GNAT family acetyltransferase